MECAVIPPYDELQLDRCANEVKPPLDGCAMSCHDLDALTGLATPGKCPQTCYDCSGWEASPKEMWLVVSTLDNAAC